MTLFDDRTRTDRPDDAPRSPEPRPRFEEPRRPPLAPAEVSRLRRRLFWWSLPLVLVALVVGVKFVSLPVVAQSAIAGYRAEDYSGAQLSAGHLFTANVVEPWIAWFDRGTAAAAGQDWVQGTDDLGKALELAPTEETACIVRVNLARAYETQADEYVKGQFFQGAINLYDTAKRIVDEGEGCFEGESQEQNEDQQDQQDQGGQGDEGDQGGQGGQDDQGDQGEQGEQGDQGGQGDQGDQGGQGDQGDQGDQGGTGQQPDVIDPKGTPGENLQDTGDRIDRKRQDATDQRDRSGGQGQQDPSNGGQGDGDSSGSSGTGDSEVDGKVDKLKDAGQDAQQDKSTEDAKNRGRNNDNGNFADRPW
ncbi:hypothetical protein [uncultured Plantibacter sp.]|uniref:hypothetical protein n=1 Tax=uncultured Plantibacter sp. TaxID=293337 RepID=UPI0028D6C394|nr:hypothetical protein [uncultured Plantibacter sp.]